MFTERTVHPDVRQLLMDGTPFKYAHLIKFERPSRPEDSTGVISTSAQRYTYLTDASRNVSFDDLSIDNTGVANGNQLYIANKVLQVSGMQEAIEAKPSNFTITLDANGIGAAVGGNGVTISAVDSIHWDITWPFNVDPVSEGFREGDKISLTGLANGSFNIQNFRANNVTRIKKIQDNATTGTGVLNMSLSSEEIKAVLLNKLDPSYASFINREVYVYRAYFVEGQLVGASPVNGVTGPVLLFKGIISNVEFDDADAAATVQWGLTSHWGDFEQVRGRITSDEFHRALDENGVPQPDSAIKPVYAFDKGFIHAETSINLLANYTVQVEEQKVKAKNGFLGLGIGAKVKVTKTMVNQTRYTNLDFQLTAKSIPVIYGVRSVDSIPVFADTLLNDGSTIYVIHALSEGQIGGLYDCSVDGKSLICADKPDYDARSHQDTEQTIETLCTGRADRGDVISGASSINTAGAPITYYRPVITTSSGAYDNTSLAVNAYAQPYSFANVNTYSGYIAPTGYSANVTSGGLTHGQSLLLTSKQSITIDFFSGTEDQEAAPALVSVSAANNFKIQNDYWNGGGASEYWGPNHRLLDTAYVLARYKIAESETSIPELTFTVRGKALDCYNYDFSYAHDDKVASESANNFKLGQVVSLYNASNDTLIVSNVQIIDKWNFVRPDGQVETRFRWSIDPNLDYVESIPSITRFYMSDGTNRWTMVTFNYELHSGTVVAELSTPVTSVAPGSPDIGGTVISHPIAPWTTIGGWGGSTPAVSLYSDGITDGRVVTGTSSTTAGFIHVNYL